MKTLTKLFFSMQAMGYFILLFAGSLAVATFVENDFGTSGAKALVYNATWFNILLILLAANLINNIIRFKMWKKKKITLFVFHISFIVVLIGAGITRFISYEGSMHIREGATSSTFLSDNTYVDVKIVDGNKETTRSQKVLMSAFSEGDFNMSMDVDGKKYKFKSVEFIPNARERIVKSNGDGDPYLVLVTSFGNSGRKSNTIKYGESQRIGTYLINFGDKFIAGAINIKLNNGFMQINANDTITSMAMSGGAKGNLPPGDWNNFSQGFLYKMQGLSMVVKNFYPDAEIRLLHYSGKDMNFKDAIIVEASSGDETVKLTVKGGKGYQGSPASINLNGNKVYITYGSKEIELPFALKCLDFQLDRYPGSKSPSSYASEVVLIDDEMGIKEQKRIFMNNVLNHRGYRFYQSSYDQDELGTILSVSHDYWGTTITYIGYLLMALGMVLSLINKNSRFALLGRIIAKNTIKRKGMTAVIALIFTLFASQLTAQHTHEFNEKNLPRVEKQQAEKFSKLLIQVQGRLAPFNTISSEYLRKITGGKSSLFGMNSDEVILSMMANPVEWQQAPIIKVKHDKVKELLGITGKKATYLDFINLSQGTYKLSKEVNAAYAKKPGERGTFEKDLIAADERLNVAYMVFTQSFLKILPDPRNSHSPWFAPNDKINGLPSADSNFIASVIPSYLNSLADGNMILANQLVKGMGDYQKKYGADIMPSQSKLELEIRYNKMNLFNRLGSLYGLLGFIMIIFSFVALFKPSKWVTVVLKVFLIIISIGFLAQTAGLAMRWYISGHAPWSDGYESMIYIAWVTMLAGLIFARKSDMTLSATTILASIILMVAHLSWMNPEITNLVPVLKSYWLTIHVSVITASYGFIALSMLLGFINLIIMIFRNKANLEHLNDNIGELTAISERAMTAGLYMLTVGTFLGGVWANESWGRYWGWDPKETWALISVLVYSFITHMRMMPGLRGRFSFNFASVIGFFSILMTYFGVNYYLSGLHSYAKGDSVPIPTFVYYSVAAIFILAIAAYINEKKFSEKK
jgi:cytochrome c-type biogenesis protein CcsB